MEKPPFFSVFHVTKYKTLGRIGSHLDRKHVIVNVDWEKSGYNEELTHTLGKVIDPTKSHLQEELADYGAMSLPEAVGKRIAAGYTQPRALRKDAVRALGVIMTGSHERMKEIEQHEGLFEDWKKANFRFACQEFGQQNIVRFSLHRDERTPHFHCVFVPITPDGRLSAKHFIGSPAQLRLYQDRYALAMEKFGLQRGIPKVLTQREHVQTKDYYRKVNALAQQAKEVTKQVRATNLLRLDTVRESLQLHITQLQVKAMEQETQYQYATIGNKTTIHNYTNKAYQERFEEEASWAFEWIKREIPLAAFAIDKLGWKAVKHKCTRRDWLLEHPQHGKIVVPTTPKAANGHWVYSLPNRRGGGTLIDLLRKEKWDWKEIKKLAHGYVPKPVATLISHNDGPVFARPIQDPKEQTRRAVSRLNGVKTKAAAGGVNYLLRRGIVPDTYQRFPQVKVKQQQAVFALYSDFDAGPRVCSTISYYWDRKGETKKYFQRGLPRGIAMLAENGEHKFIVVTESPIDALSYRQIKFLNAASRERKNLDQTCYLATCGSLSVAIKQELAHVFDQAKVKNQQVILALDNDLAGKAMTRDLEVLLQQKQCSYHVVTPEVGKDWNEELLIGKRDQQVQECWAQDKLYGFPNSKYEDAILHQAGITQADCEGIYLKATERAITFGLHRNIAAKPRLCSTITYQWEPDGNRKHYFQQGLPRGLAIFEPAKDVKHIIITANPLEALQHRRSNPKAQHTRYLCTCGPLTRSIQLELAQVLQQAQEKNQSVVCMGLDKRAITKLKDARKEKPSHLQVLPKSRDMMNVLAVLSKVAYTMAAIAKLNSYTAAADEGEEEAERVNKKKKKGRGMRR